MITVSVTSDSSAKELELGLKFVREIYELKVGVNDQTNLELFSKSEVFTTTELAEAEALGKPVCSTVDAAASQTALVGATVNTSIPTPQSVFAQPAQTVVSEVTPVAPVTESPATDADGLVWNERIHSSSKEFNKDGTWRKRRGAKVEDELRGEPAQVITEHNVAVTPPANPLPVGGSMTFLDLLDGVTKAMVAGKLTQARINEALNSIGVQAVAHLIARADLIPAFRQALGGVV